MSDHVTEENFSDVGRDFKDDGAQTAVESARNLAAELHGMSPEERNGIIDRYNTGNDGESLPDARIETKDGQEFLVFDHMDATGRSSSVNAEISADSGNTQGTESSSGSGLHESGPPSTEGVEPGK